MCYDAKNFKALKENLHLLNKRRAQLKAAIKAMVKRCMELLDSLQYDQKMDLLNTLISITEGKVRSPIAQSLVSCPSPSPCTPADSYVLS